MGSDSAASTVNVSKAWRELGAPVSDAETWTLPEAPGSFPAEESEDKDISKSQALCI